MWRISASSVTQVWQGYVHPVVVANGNEICTNVGRLTSSFYEQFTIYKYAPFLTQLADCSFVRETFTEISADDCPDLSRYSRWVYASLAAISVSGMLSLIFWIVYAREGLGAAPGEYTKQFILQQEEQYKRRRL